MQSAVIGQEVDSEFLEHFELRRTKVARFKTATFQK